MPSSPPPRRGIGGVLGLLAVLAFVILAAVILMRKEPEKVVQAPPTAPAEPVTTTMPMPPASEAPPSTEPAAPVVSPDPEPAPVTGASPLPGKAARSSRRTAATPPPSGTRVADADPVTRRGTGSLPPAAGPAPRRFILGTTSIESLKPVTERDLKGFEPGGVGVKRAPEVNGRVELEMDPPQVRPGVDYTVKVYLANDGNRDIAVEEVKVSTVENGRTASRTATPRARNVKPHQRTLLHEVSGVWREAARSWAMDVIVTSGRQDVYRNNLRWE
jgi:hypothetical protein